MRILLTFCILLCVMLAACADAPQESEEVVFFAQETSVEETTPAEMVSSAEDMSGFLAPEQQFVATYRVESDDPKMASTSTLIYYFLDESNQRKDIITEDGENRYLLSADEQKTCYDIAGHWACHDEIFHAPGYASYLASVSLDDYQVVTQAPKRFGADAAPCFAMAGLEDSAEFCFLQGGIVIYGKIIDGEYTTTYTALDIEEVVDPGVFTLP